MPPAKRVVMTVGEALTAVFAEDALLGKIKASPLGCMDNLRQNDWFGFFGETAFLPAPVTALRTWAATLRCRLPWRFRGPGDQRRSSRPHRYRRGREFCLPEGW